MYMGTEGAGTLFIVLVMALVTLLTRWGGVFVMTFIPINDSVKRFIDGMSVSVLVALLTPMALTGDNGVRLALLTTAAIMLSVKKPLLAIAAGMLAAALLRQF